MNNLNFKKISRELFSLALPMAFAQFISVGSGFLSMVMLSHLGQDVLAASALIFSTRLSIMIIGSSILFSLSVLIGHAYGERKYERIGNFMQQGWALGLFISIPMIIIFWNIHPILMHFGQSKLIADIVEPFFRVNLWSILPFLLAVCNQQLCYGIKKQKIDFWGSLFSVFVLLISGYIFIFGHWGFKKLGVAGLGYALNLQICFYLLFTSTIIYFDKFFNPFKIFAFRIHQTWRDFIHLFKIGWPISIQISGELLSLFASAAMVGWINTKSLAAYQVVTQYMFLVIVPLFTLAQASGILISQAFGEKNYLKIKKIGHAGMIFSLIIAFTVTIICISFPKQLSSLYLNSHDPNNADTLHIIMILFIIFAIQQIFDGVRNMLTGSLRGLFDTKFPMIAGLFAIWVIGIPLEYILAFNFSLEAPGIALGGTIGIFIGMILVLYRWHRKSNL